MDWWADLLPETRAALISGGATIMAAGLAAFVVMFQIGFQSRHAINQNAKNEAVTGMSMRR